MTFRKRVALIVVGIIVFVILAPAAILLARGYFFDLGSHRFIKTGTLTIKTSPRGAGVFFNNQKFRSATPLTKRFLLPGEYPVEITKPDFKPWKKRITIRPQMVTYLPDTLADKIYLFLETPETSLLSSTTSDFLLDETGLFSINPQTVVQNDVEGLNHQVIMASTTLNFIDPKILDSRTDRLGNSSFLIATREQTIYLTKELYFPLPKDYRLTAFDHYTDGLLAVNEKNELVKFGSDSKKPEILQKDVQNFTAENGLYYLSRGPGTQLFQITNSGNAVSLLRNLPLFTQSQIIVTPNKQIFLCLDESLYAVRETLEKINERVRYAFWNNDLPGLVYGNGHELWLYQSESGLNTLLSRTSQIFGQTEYNAKTGYAFVAEGNQIKAIEFDSLGQDNVFLIAETKNPNPKFALDREGANLIYLDGKELVSLKIR